MRFTHDPESGAFYVRLREGEYHQTIPLIEPLYGGGVDVDAEGNVLGVEFLSFEEFAVLVESAGGTQELPDRVGGGILWGMRSEAASEDTAARRRLRRDRTPRVE